MHQASFHSDNLDPALEDDRRFSLWYETVEALTCCVDITRFDDRPFQGFLRWSDFQDVHVTRFGGTFGRIRRSRSAISRGPDDDFCLVFHRGSGTLRVDQSNREANLAAGGAFLGTNGMPADMSSDAPFAWTTLTVGRERLRALVGHADDLLARPLDPQRPAVTHLRRYIESVVKLSRAPHDPQLDAHIRTTLLDLTALVLGARGDAAQIATTRGLRASRIHDIIAEIERGFMNAGFSAAHVARHLGLSTRYVQDLLHETGQSFTERLLERRLQQARHMLASERGDRLKISEIALACGFGEVSYFNQRFRRRFGVTPTECRRDSPR
ncbi:AraC family transcriptional regulator [Bradyrhizobium sp. BRP22]|uniref:AraC family transcriptional regulator n=1 Tax=Bradyrhizobium sp. BRP22 TaxID=2793821 RepID=UPI001CD3C582|nr:AraC family transcriptional regulator [Bradyrhizobium sp. BRP22]MCA1454442.1 AraC family transcriptional regulator [Bradyrhizobium sp. BRP22]